MVSSAQEEKPMDVDEILVHAGDFGCYQVLLIALYAVINVLSAFHYFGQTFISIVPDHRCRLPELGRHPDSRFWPADAACSRYDLNLTGLSPPADGHGWRTRRCDTGWEYNRTLGYESIVSEYDWVCDDAWMSVLGQSIYFIGSVGGTLAIGIMSDKVGRRPALVLANALAMVANCATALSTSLATFGAFRFVAGFATDNNFYMMYIIVMEYLSPRMRTMGLNLTIGLFYTLGSAAVPWAALYLGNWRLFMQVVAAAHAVVPFYWLLVPESARWLLQKGRVEDAVSNFNKVARFNRRVLSPEIMQAFESSAKMDGEKKSTSLLGLFKTPRLRRKTCILTFKSMVLTLCYDAISRNVTGLGYSPFVLFSVSAATILPACVVIMLFQDRVGRKAMACSALLFSGLFTATAGVLLAVYGADGGLLLTAVLAVVGRFCINVAYNSGVQYAAELIPTEVRGQGVSAIHVAGYAATFFSPYILFLVNYWRALPELTLGALLVTGAALCLLLPETLNRELPVTLEDGEAFGEGEGVWEFSCCQRPEGRTTSTQQLVLNSA